MKYVTRINLKPEASERSDLINFCLKNERQYLAIGWHKASEELENFSPYINYYNNIKKLDKFKRYNGAHNVFLNTQENDLFWTRDLDGYYWICRAKGRAVAYYDSELDIGAVVEVEAYKFSTSVPGQIKASFNRANAGTTQKIYDKTIVEYSKHIFNTCSKRSVYEVTPLSTQKNCVIDNLPDLDLEELVIAYVQVKYNYYVLSNSIASKSTTIKVECEFMSRDAKKPRKAVVQVKANGVPLYAKDYEAFFTNGYEVFLYSEKCFCDGYENVVGIAKAELLAFYNEHKDNLPSSITCWEVLY